MQPQELFLLFFEMPGLHETGRRGRNLIFEKHFYHFQLLQENQGEFDMSSRRINNNTFFILLLAIYALILAACGSSDTSDKGNELTIPQYYKVGGSVTGLNGTLVLHYQGGSAHTLSKNGSFTLNNAVAGATYDIVIQSQPSGQVCTITNGSGTVRTADVTNIQVTCDTKATNFQVKVLFPTTKSMTYGNTVKVYGTISSDDTEADGHSILGFVQSMDSTDSSDDVVVTAVLVNGIPAQSEDGFSTWEVEVPLESGENTLTVETIDSNSNINPNAAEIVIVRPFAVTGAVAIDIVNHRVLFVDQFNKSIVAVDLSSGNSKILSDNTIPNAFNPFDLPYNIAIDSVNNRALVIDQNVYSKIIAVNLDTGARTILSDDITPNTANPFSALDAIAMDAANNRALILDSGQNAIIAMDLDTGLRSIMAPSINPAGLNYFGQIDIAIDSSNSRALVIDAELHAIVAFDLSTGDRSVFLDMDPDDVLWYGRIAVDSMNNRALVTDSNFHPKVIAVNLDTGARTILSDNTPPDANNTLYEPRGIAIDNAGNRALITDTGSNSIIAVDLDTGARTIFKEERIPDNINPFVHPAGVTMDGANNRALVVDGGRNEIIAVDLKTGARTILSGNTTPNDFYPFSKLDPSAGIAIDNTRNRALIPDLGRGAVIAVDLTTGARSIFLNSLTTDPSDPVWFSGIAIDSVNNQALITDNWNNAVFAVDLDSGNHTILSDKTTLNAGDPFSAIGIGIAVDEVKNRALVVDTMRNAIVTVDLDTGKRDILMEDENLNMHAGITVDSANNRALVVNGPRSILAVDLATGDCSIVSDYTSQNAVNPIHGAHAIALDTINNRILVTDYTVIGALFAVDPKSGDRVILSK